MRLYYLFEYKLFWECAKSVTLGRCNFLWIAARSESITWLNILYSIFSKRPMIGTIVSWHMIVGAVVLFPTIVVIAYIFITIFVQPSQLYLNMLQYSPGRAGVQAYIF
jgi:hypothetical protein